MRWPIRLALGLGSLAMAAGVSVPASAAEDDAPNVIVNQDILSNLDWAAAVSARVGAEARALVAASTEVKPAPGSPPISRLLVEPRRPTPPSPPSEQPTALAGSTEEPAPAEAEVDATARRELAAAGGETAAPVVEPVVEPTPPPESTAASIEAPPAIPSPPEPSSPTSAVVAPVAAPAPPEPQPALPESVLVAQAPSPPEPEPAPKPAIPENRAEAEPEPEPTRTQTAARLPRALVVGDVRLLFPEGSVDLSETAQDKLAALAQQLQQDRDAERRIQLQAFASSASTNASVARRLSLARALAVRTFLIEKGIRAKRIDVRALGAKSDQGPPDRVDILDARS